jgi:hypothetical protein|tara:strand:+ start:31374 stop:31493 length:120 start_codon:yes stop_codon:yes gene_type:complete
MFFYAATVEANQAIKRELYLVSLKNELINHACGMQALKN